VLEELIDWFDSAKRILLTILVPWLFVWLDLESGTSIEIGASEQ
jgi:hypothetical protein